jgi:hypothetical protein
MLGYVADAARYLTPSPANIKARNAIRKEGINLIRALHESGKYNRIVIVGHSLGSVIGYDIIRHLWGSLRKPSQKQPEAKAFGVAAGKIEVAQSVLDAIKVLNLEAEKLEGVQFYAPDVIDAFQETQHRLWSELHSMGVPWLVTDFVTLGSPLAHALLLMADDEADFTRRKEQLEYPCCPPSPSDALDYAKGYTVGQGDQTPSYGGRVAHNGAPFCCTRWTNLYFPYRNLILGDIVGGPINGVLGKGVRDIAVVPSTGKWLDGTLLSHVRYWAEGNADATKGNSGTLSLDALRSALRLETRRKTPD